MIDPEMGNKTAQQEEEDAMQYLPESAALLVTALQGTAKKKKKPKTSKSEGDESPNNLLLSGSGSFDNLPSLIEEAASKINERGLTLTAEDFFSTPTKNTLEMDMKEMEADMLLESIRKDELNRSTKKASVKKKKRSPGVSRRSSQASFDEDDDEGSMVGDMARLSQSTFNLARDLENIDFSQLEGYFPDDGGSMDQYDGENGLLGRLKIWFARGMIMEQKLLNTYINPIDNNGENNDGTATASTGPTAARYSENPVLVWSLAIMWSFVVLILMHPKIAELVEGGDPGQLADIIEWMFG